MFGVQESMKKMMIQKKMRNLLMRVWIQMIVKFFFYLNVNPVVFFKYHQIFLKIIECQCSSSSHRRIKACEGRV